MFSNKVKIDLSNIDEVYNSNPNNELKYKFIDFVEKDILEELKVRNISQKLLIKKVPHSAIIYFNLKTKEEIRFLKKWIKKKRKSLENLVENNQSKLPNNKHPDIFKDNGFEIFLKWIELSEDEPIKKFSFIIQKLKSNDIDKIRNSKFKFIIKWLKDNNFIDEEIYKVFFERNSFHSPTKILTYSRNELYNTITTN